MRLNVGLVAALLVAPLLGCGDSGPKVAPVTGKVTIGGTPADQVQISFNPVDAGLEMASGTVEADGTYTLRTGVQGKEGAMPGKYKVVLSDTNFDDRSYMESGGAPPAANSSDGGSPGAPVATATGRVPQEYTSAETTPKEVEVTDGDNTINIEIP